MAQRVRLVDEADQLVAAIKEAVAKAKGFKKRKDLHLFGPEVHIEPTFSFVITDVGIQIEARYLCYRTSAIATFKELAQSRGKVLRHTMDTAFSRLKARVKHVRNGHPIS